MKGDKAEYYISFEKAFMFPRPKRVRKALCAIRDFVAKHTRAKDIYVSNEVNELVHKNSKNIPRGISAVLYREEGKISVFVQNGSGLDAYVKKRAEEKKKKDSRKAEKAGKKEEKKAGKTDVVGAVAAKGAKAEGAQAKGEGEEQKRLLEEKRQKEEAGKAIEMKRK